MSDAWSFAAIGRVDWYVSKTYNKLHWAELTTEQAEHAEDEWFVEGPVRMACGRVAGSLHIPGIFTRQAAARCSGCCRKLGYPQGIGSPKNDQACRPLLGVT